MTFLLSLTISILIVVLPFLLSVKKSIEYGKLKNSLVYGLLEFIAYLILFYGPIVLILGNIIGEMAITGTTNKNFWFLLKVISICIYWYGILEFSNKNISKILNAVGLVGLLVLNPTLFVMLFTPYMWPFVGVNIYFLIKIWAPKKRNHNKRSKEFKEIEDSSSDFKGL